MRWRAPCATRAESDEALLCQMLAIQYDNKGDKDRSVSYRERAERSLDAAVSK